MEQVAWNPTHHYAGQVDLIAWDQYGRYGGGLGIVDLKTSNYTLDTHHLQVRAYQHAVHRLFPCGWGLLVKVPKSKDKKFEVTPLGKLWDRGLSSEELWSAFCGALTLSRTLVGVQWAYDLRAQDARNEETK